MTPTIEMMGRAVVALAACYVIAGCVCRFAIMHPTTTAWRWPFMYAGVGWWAAHGLHAALAGGAVDERDIVGTVTVALYIHATRSRWPGEVPEIARRKQ